MGRRARSWSAALAVFLAALTACDSGPSGPGAIRATVNTDEALGAVTLEVVGRGVVGFEGLGDTEAYGAVVSAGQNRHRVVLVNPVGGDLEFRIRVEDVGGALPMIRVVAAAGTDNVERLTGGIEVDLEG